MKKILIITLFMLTLAGCASVSNNETEGKMAELEALIDKREQTINELNTKLEVLGKNEAGKALCDNLLPVYGLDSNAQNAEIQFYVDVSEVLNLNDRLQLLANKLSQFKFANLPMEVMKIEAQHGKQVATLNLKELTAEGQPSWSRGYFQGSAGGQATTFTLIQTFLQPDHEGEWIDGIEFYYEGEPMSQWDHLDLEGIKWRDELS